MICGPFFPGRPLHQNLVQSQAQRAEFGAQGRPVDSQQIAGLGLMSVRLLEQPGDQHPFRSFYHLAMKVRFAALQERFD